MTTRLRNATMLVVWLACSAPLVHAAEDEPVGDAVATSRGFGSYGPTGSGMASARAITPARAVAAQVSGLAR